MCLGCHFIQRVIDNSLHREQQQPKKFQLEFYDNSVNKKEELILGLNQF